MEFFKKKTAINFLGLRKYAATFSIILFILSITSLSVKGLNWGLDFTGGTQIQVSYPQAADVMTVRTELDNAGFKEAVVQSYGNSENLLISLAPRANVDQQHLTQQVMSVLQGAKLQRVDYVGPKVGQEMATKGFLAILVALLGTMIYIAIRFEYRFAIGSAGRLPVSGTRTLGNRPWRPHRSCAGNAPRCRCNQARGVPAGHRRCGSRRFARNRPWRRAGAQPP